MSGRHCSHRQFEDPGGAPDPDDPTRKQDSKPDNPCLIVQADRQQWLPHPKPMYRPPLHEHPVTIGRRSQALPSLTKSLRNPDRR
jgi:hypothetical protein